MCTVNLKRLKECNYTYNHTLLQWIYTLYIIIPHGNGHANGVWGIYTVDSLISSGVYTYPVKSDRRCESIVTF